MKRIDSSIKFLIAPVTLRVLLIGLALGLASGVSVLLWSDRDAGHDIADLASSYALLVSLSFIFGWLLATFVIDAVIRLLMHILSIVTERIEKIASHLAVSLSPIEMSHSSNESLSRLFAVVRIYGFVIGLGAVSVLLIYAVLYNQIYAGASLPAAVNWFVEGKYLYGALLGSFGTAALSITLIVVPIARQWVKTRTLERLAADVKASAGFQELNKENRDMADAVTMTDERLVKLTDIRADVQHSLNAISAGQFHNRGS